MDNTKSSPPQVPAGRECWASILDESKFGFGGGLTWVSAWENEGEAEREASRMTAMGYPSHVIHLREVVEPSPVTVEAPLQICLGCGDLNATTASFPTGGGDYDEGCAKCGAEMDFLESREEAIKELVKERNHYRDAYYTSEGKALEAQPKAEAPDLEAAIRNILATVRDAANGYHNTQQWGDAEYGNPSYWEKIEQAEEIALRVANAAAPSVTEEAGASYIDESELSRIQAGMESEQRILPSQAQCWAMVKEIRRLQAPSHPAGSPDLREALGKFLYEYGSHPRPWEIAIEHDKERHRKGADRILSLLPSGIQPGSLDREALLAVKAWWDAPGPGSGYRLQDAIEKVEEALAVSQGEPRTGTGLSAVRSHLYAAREKINVDSPAWDQVVLASRALDLYERTTQPPPSSGGEQGEKCTRLERAVLWALGEYGEFKPYNEGYKRYWWRSELRARAFPGTLPDPKHDLATPPTGEPPAADKVEGFMASHSYTCAWRMDEPCNCGYESSQPPVPGEKGERG